MMFVPPLDSMSKHSLDGKTHHGPKDTYKHFQSKASAEVKEYTLEEWLMQQDRVSGTQKSQEVSQDEGSNHGNRMRTNKNKNKSNEGIAQVKTDEEDSGVDSQTKQVSTKEDKE